MIRYILILLAIHFCIPAHAQKIQKFRALEVAYNDSKVCRNVNLTYRHEVGKKWSLYGGLKYHINDNNYRGDVVPLTYITPNEHAYFAKLEATTLKEHIGLKFGVEKAFVIPKTNTELLGFYDFMYTNAGMNAVGGGIDSTGNTFMYTPWPGMPGGYSSGGNLFEHHLGVGIRVQAYKQLHISLSSGIGFYKYDNAGTFYGVKIFSATPAFSHMFGFGVDYLFIKKQPSKRR